jgi:L-seryl-tRNA(Ser) seleniumtransferase
MESVPLRSPQLLDCFLYEGTEMTKFHERNADLFTRYGLRRIINASGTETTKGASPVCPEVIAAVSELVANSVEMAELQSAACHVIAKAVGTEAGVVTNCSAAGICMAVAATMTGTDLARIERLPDTAGLKNEVILQRGHNVTYGGHIEQNIRLVGAKVVEIGAATECGVYQLESALCERTACAIYVVSHHTVQSGLIDLTSFASACRKRGIPVIVDAAAEPNPRSFLDAGGDLVIFSIQKRYAGLTGGVVAGRLDLVRATMWQEKGIARPMKVGKETVISAITALERWRMQDTAEIARQLDARLSHAVGRLASVPGLRAQAEVDATVPTFSRLHLYIDEKKAGVSAFGLSQALWNGTPSIFVRNLMADIGLLQVDLRLQTEATTDFICDRILDAMAAARAAPVVADPAHAPATANLADLALRGMERWPLPLKMEI